MEKSYYIADRTTKSHFTSLLSGIGNGSCLNKWSCGTIIDYNIKIRK
jgi:hypothetical protein